MGKNNLDSIFIKTERVLPKKDEQIKKKELDNKVISIKITETEFLMIKEKAGELVPLGTYVKHFLRTKTNLFSRQD